MILWVILFILVVAISFVLAAKSMRDYQEIPTKQDQYSLFLIRKSLALSKQLLDEIHADLFKSNLILSFERLIKGNKAALVIFGPKSIILKYRLKLDLIELEDYTNCDLEQISAWEVAIKNKGMEDIKNVFEGLPSLSDTEQFWWQLTLSSSKDQSFKINIRAILVAADEANRKKLTQTLQNLAPGLFLKLPKAFSNEQLLDFYKKRSFSKDTQNPTLDSSNVLKLLTI